MKIYLFTLIAFCFYQTQAQDLLDISVPKEKIEHFIVSNFSGSIQIEQNRTAQIKVKAVLRKGTLDPNVKLQYVTKDDFLKVYFKTPCSKDKSQITFDPQEPMHMDQWSNDCKWEAETENIFVPVDFTIEVPEGVHVYASTIMDGDINVEHITSSIWTNNVNGDIVCQGVDRVTQAKTVNGNIEILYNNTPKSDGEFSTINGDIEARVDPNVNLIATFKSFQGDFYTDIESINFLPSEVVSQSKEKGFKYKVSEYSKMQLGSGGLTLAFETFNGDAYLKTKNSVY